MHSSAAGSCLCNVQRWSMSLSKEGTVTEGRKGVGNLEHNRKKILKNELGEVTCIHVK